MKLTTDVDKLIFHDTSIEKIERQSGTIILEIGDAFISKEPPGSEGQDWKVEEARLELFGVTEERATYWEDNKAAKNHPEPEFPLSEIMCTHYLYGVFSFVRFKGTVPWHE